MKILYNLSAVFIAISVSTAWSTGFAAMEDLADPFDGSTQKANIAKPESWQTIQQLFAPTFINRDVKEQFLLGFKAIYETGESAESEEQLRQRYQTLFATLKSLKAQISNPDEKENAQTADMALEKLAEEQCEKIKSFDEFSAKAQKNVVVEKAENIESWPQLQGIFHPVFISDEVEHKFIDWFSVLYNNSSPKHTGGALLKMYQCLYASLIRARAANPLPSRDEDEDYYTIIFNAVTFTQTEEVKKRAGFKSHINVFKKHAPEQAVILSGTQTCMECYRNPSTSPIVSRSPRGE